MREKAITVAVLSDVHGNLPAIEAVLADFRNRDVDRIWNLGDFVGYVPFPNEVIERLRDCGALSIIGNYDLKVLSFARKKRQWEKQKSADKFAVFEWNYKALSRSNRKYLGALPKTRRIKIAGLTVLLTHGSPASEDEGIIATTPARRLKELAAMVRADVILCGHTHRPMTRRTAKVLFINPGSVGRPEGDRRASYAILKFTGCGTGFQPVKTRPGWPCHVTVRHYKVEYDISKAAAAIRRAALSAGLIDVLEKAASLDVLKQQSKSRVSDKLTDEKRLKAVLALARKCNYEREHTHQVERLALKIFDQLARLHHLGSRERFLLHCGTILHDIGWIEGQKGHHKTALRIIMEDSNLPFDFRSKCIIGLLAKYHRKALPSNQHTYFRDLNVKDRNIVSILAGILRVADGLDRTHRSLVRDISCRVSGRRIILSCRSVEPLEWEFAASGDKAELFEKVFIKKLVLKRESVYKKHNESSG
jgi:putative phosphoesterase